MEKETISPAGHEAGLVLPKDQNQIEFILGLSKIRMNIIDREYNLRYVDPVWAKACGDWIGRKCHEYFLKVKNPCPACRVAEAFASKQPIIEERPVNDQSGRYTSVTSTPYRSASGEWLVAQVNINVTERRQSEKALKESEEKFRQLAEHSPNMIFINQSGQIIYANKKCQELMGYSRQEFYADNFDFMGMIAPESRALIKDNLKKHAQGREIPPYEYKLITKSGQIITAIHATKLIEINGRPAILGVITDISDLVRAQEHIRSQAAALTQKNTALKELLEHISLEKKQLTDRMRLNLDKLVLPKLKRIKSKSDDKLRRQLAIIEQNIKSIDSVFGQKISARHHALSPREIEVCDMIKNGLKNKAIARELRLSFDTVETMRKNIRRKLRLRNKDVNLRSYLARI